MNVSVWILKIFKRNTTFSKKTYVSFSFWFFLFFFIRVIFFDINKDALDYSNTNFKILGLNFPSNLSFANEKVPINDIEIKKSLEKEFFENKKWKSSSFILFNKAQKWFPLIEPILKKEGVPDDFKYIAVIESHLSNVISPVGAAGFWQLMPTTAMGYGLIITNDVDERYDVEKATRVACKHFKDGYAYFKNWTLSAAAYNVGIGGIQKAMKDQKTNSYYDLLLNNETGSFIYRILAFKTLLSNPNHFGVKQKIITHSFPSFKIVKVDSSITNLNSFANHFDISLVTLKTCNSWLIGDKLSNPEKHTFEFKIPKNKKNDLSIYYNDIFPAKIKIDSLSSFIKTDSIIPKIDSLKK